MMSVMQEDHGNYIVKCDSEDSVADVLRVLPKIGDEYHGSTLSVATVEYLSEFLYRVSYQVDPVK
jgi:hypothetical protein